VTTKKPPANTDGLVNYLPASRGHVDSPDTYILTRNTLQLKLNSFIKLSCTMTNPAHLSGPRHLDNFIVTPNARPSIGTLQKPMPTLTRTATYQTAGPLGVRIRCKTVIANAQARVWQPIPANILLLPNTCFLPNLDINIMTINKYN
jgi:hypothetical protein